MGYYDLDDDAREAFRENMLDGMTVADLYNTIGDKTCEMLDLVVADAAERTYKEA